MLRGINRRHDLETVGVDLLRRKAANARQPLVGVVAEEADVDDRYFALATQMLAPASRDRDVLAVFGTHDRRLIQRIATHADASTILRDAYEFHLLFGIEREEQLRLAQDGRRVKVLISYGEQWFPWYMRRLAERPANLLFVAKSMLSN